MVLPRPSGDSFDSPGVACNVSELDMIECPDELSICADILNSTLETLNAGKRKVLPEKINLGTRRRFAFQINGKLEREAYVLNVRADTVTVTGGSANGVFYGTQSLKQILFACAANGGHDILLPVGGFTDAPKFEYRGFMIDSARHFQKKETLFRLIDILAAYKINRFHWHINDRQSWRLPVASHPEIMHECPKEHTFSFGMYTKKDIEEVRDYAEKHFMTVIPEIEMPGHSAIVFRDRPDLACPATDDPFGNDAWEYCLGNPDVKTFLTDILKETCELFPSSPVIHIGGDEAGTARWNACTKCKKALADLGSNDMRDLEHKFMLDMEKILASMGRSAMTWGTSGSIDFSGNMIIQDWLGAETMRAVKAGLKAVNSFHLANYFDYPNEINVDETGYIESNYVFDPVPDGVSEAEAALVIGSEACLWTESIPEWRVEARTLPRIGAFAEMVWTPKNKRDFKDFTIRSRRLVNSGFRY